MDSGKSSPSSLSRSNSLRMSNCNRTSLVRRNQSMNAKQIHFYRNGDRYFTGLKLAVSPDRYKEFDSLLTELSSKLNLSTGAVRYVFNAEDGNLITDVTQLMYGVSYVCSSSTSFRQIEVGYGKLVQSWSSMSKTKNQYRPLQAIGNIENHQPFRCENSSKEFIKPKLVTVIRNGKPPQKKVTLLLNSKTAISLDQVLDQLSAKGSLGKVDKLHTTDGKPIRALRDLFDDNTVFIALSTNEKFPDDGIELDPNSYRITPYREMKKPGSMTVRRSNSLRHGMRYKDENENMSLSRISKNLKSNNVMKLNTSKVARPRGSAQNNNEQNIKDELYPTSVFETDSESAKAKKRRTKYDKIGNSATDNVLDIYSTVWLSDYESVRSCGSRSICSTLNQSGISYTEINNINHSTPSNNIHQSNLAGSYPPFRQLCCTLSLPDLELAALTGNHLNDRFCRLQLEQDNRQLQNLVDELKSELEEVGVHFTSQTNYDKCCDQCVTSMNKINNILSHSKSKVSSMYISESSGYDTMPNETIYNDTIQFDEECSNSDGNDVMEYTLSEEEKYFESRLSRHRRHFYHKERRNSCCIMQ